MEEVDGSNPSRSTKLNPNKTNTYDFGMSASMLAGEVTGVHVESKLDSGPDYRRQSVGHRILNEATRAGLCLTALWLRLPAGEPVSSVRA